MNPHGEKSHIRWTYVRAIRLAQITLTVMAVGHNSIFGVSVWLHAIGIGFFFLCVDFAQWQIRRFDGWCELQSKVVDEMWRRTRIFIDRAVINHHQRRCEKRQSKSLDLQTLIDCNSKSFLFDGLESRKKKYANCPFTINTLLSAVTCTNCDSVHAAFPQKKIKSKSSGDNSFIYLILFVIFTSNSKWAQSRTLAGVPPVHHIELSRVLLVTEHVAVYRSHVWTYIKI